MSANTSIVARLLAASVMAVADVKATVASVMAEIAAADQLITYTELKARVGCKSRYSNVGRQLDKLDIDIQERCVDAATKVPGLGFWKKLIAEAQGDAGILEEISAYEVALKAQNKAKVLVGKAATTTTTTSKLDMLRGKVL